MTKNQEVFAKATESMLARMEAGVDPWRSGYTRLLPTSVNSGKPYSGANYFNLAMATAACGYRSNQWLTFAEAIKRGGHVKKGEKGTCIVRWREWDPAGSKSKDAEVEAQGQEPGGKEARKSSRPRMFAFVNHVFNYDQTEGVTLDVDPYPAAVELKPEEVHLKAQQFVDAAAVCPILEQGDTPCYIPSKDIIEMPPKALWTGGLDRFYNTVFHEMAHATGHKDRLARTFGGHGTEDYAYEEMVALFAQNYLSANVGLDCSTLEPINAAYLKSWAGKCRDNPELLYKAQKDGFTAGNYLIERARPKETPALVAQSPADHAAALLRDIEHLPDTPEHELAMAGGAR